MTIHRWRVWFKYGFILSSVALFPVSAYASFIEATLGTAVINDATAALYNPAALTLLKNSQVIGLGSFPNPQSKFTGQVIQTATGFTLSGNSNSQTHYFLPSFYIGVPTSPNVSAGVAFVANFFNKEIDDSSILRYAQPSSNINNIDVIPALGMKLNDFIAIGGSINLSYADFLLQPIVGFPSVNIPDSQSRNEANGTAFGGDAGLLFTPSKATAIGINYRSSLTYRLSGKSIFPGNPAVVSDTYSFTVWTPARSVISFSQFIKPNFGVIGTAEYVQWNIVNQSYHRGIATRIGTQAAIINGVIIDRLHNAWVLTVGTHYRPIPKWAIRFAATYNQSAGNPHYQISNGDTLVAGMSTGYTLSKAFTIDASYAHGFTRNQRINIYTGKNAIVGLNEGFVNAYSLKLTVNIV